MAAPPLPRLLLAVGAAAAAAGDGCTAGCDLALGFYYISPNQNVNYIFFGCSCLALPSAPASTYLAGLIPFPLSRGQTYSSIANNYYNLTTADWLQKTNTYPPNNIPDTGTVNVTVNCSCGDASVSPDYGLFLTYPLRDGETLTSAAVNNGFSSPSQMDLLRKYNPGMDSVVGRGIVYVPVKDPDGSYLPLKSSGPGKGAPVGAIAGGVVAAAVALVLGVLVYIMFYRRTKAKEAAVLPSSEDSTQPASTLLMDKVTPSTTQAADRVSPVAGITVDKSVEFSYQQLFNATEGFSIGNKIGQGGFGSVYYAELRGEKAAIKKWICRLLMSSLLS